MFKDMNLNQDRGDIARWERPLSMFLWTFNEQTLRQRSDQGYVRHDKKTKKTDKAQDDVSEGTERPYAAVQSAMDNTLDDWNQEYGWSARHYDQWSSSASSWKSSSGASKRSRSTDQRWKNNPRSVIGSDASTAASKGTEKGKRQKTKHWVEKP